MKPGRREFLKGLLMAGPAVAAAKVLPATVPTVRKSTDTVPLPQGMCCSTECVAYTLGPMGSTVLPPKDWS